VAKTVQISGGLFRSQYIGASQGHVFVGCGVPSFKVKCCAVCSLMTRMVKSTFQKPSWAHLSFKLLHLTEILRRWTKLIP